MALDIILVLDTDTPEGMRVICNDNFTLLANELNQIANYIDSDFGILTGLSSVETNELKVNSNKLVVNNSGSILNDNFQLNGNLKLSGNFINTNIYSTIISNTLSEVINNGGEYNVGTSSTYPPYSVYKVTSSDVSGLTVNLFSADQGQDLFFVMVNDIAGVETVVKIRQAITSSSYFYLPSGMNYITLTEIGQTIHLRYIEDGWYVVGGNGYSFV